MSHTLFSSIEDCPLIAAIKDENGLNNVLQLDNKVVFVLYGDLFSIADIVQKLHKADKIAIVHLDLIGGLSNREIAVDYMKYKVGADGIITTKAALIKRGKELGLLTILRFFVFDTMALQNVAKAGVSAKPDLIEILPGIMPKVIKKIHQAIPTPIICGGLIMDKEDVMEALKAGAIAISTSNEEVWSM